MKNSDSNALRWLRQGEYDLNQAEKSLADSSYAYSAFFSEQAAQKALKAFLFKSGERTVVIHSVAELVKKAIGFEGAFSQLVEKGARLDRHYLSSRYPDALPESAIPYESYAEDDAKEAVAIAQEILKTAKRLI